MKRPRASSRLPSPRLRGRPLSDAVIMCMCTIFRDDAIPTHWRILAAGACLEFFHGPAPASVLNA